MSKTKRVIALGFFDGVHLGHGALLRTVKETADRLGARACAFTFDRSPTAVITGRDVPLLSTVEDRIFLMRQCYGIEEVVVAPFDAMQRMDWVTTRIECFRIISSTSAPLAGLPIAIPSANVGFTSTLTM